MKAAKKQPAAWVKGTIAPSQIKAIKTVIGKLGMEDEDYRHMLHSRYNGATSCKDLTWRQAEELLEHLNGKPNPSPASQPLQTSPYQGRFKNNLPPDKGGLRGVGGRGLKYTDMDSRPGFASGAQCRLVDAMWNQVTRAENEEDAEKALNSFCDRILGVAGLRMVKAWQVEKIIKALEAMGAVIKRTGGAA